MILRRAPIAALALALALFTIFACKSSSTKSATPSIAVTASPRGPTPGTTRPAGDIRSIDLEHSAPVQQALAANGGQYVQTSVIYADLTGDGVDEAIVPISSGGTLGNIAYVVLTPNGSGVTQLLASSPDPRTGGGVAVAVVDGKLVETRPIYGPEDPNCCPSMLRTTTFAWDGSKLVQESTSTSANPAGGPKPTSPANPPR